MCQAAKWGAFPPPCSSPARAAAHPLGGQRAAAPAARRGAPHGPPTHPPRLSPGRRGCTHRLRVAALWRAASDGHRRNDVGSTGDWPLKVAATCEGARKVASERTAQRKGKHRLERWKALECPRRAAPTAAKERLGERTRRRNKEERRDRAPPKSLCAGLRALPKLLRAAAVRAALHQGVLATLRAAACESVHG